MAGDHSNSSEYSPDGAAFALGGLKQQTFASSTNFRRGVERALRVMVQAAGDR